MSCISKGNTRCTKCCEAIHIDKRQWNRIKRGIADVGASQSITKYWKPISARRAKKINPYIWKRNSAKVLEGLELRVGTVMQFFTCTALVKGVGCSIRDQEDHPEVCKTFESDDSYSPDCKFDINIIARG